MDTGFHEKEEERQIKLLTIACRFVPYDQWLVTHVDSAWTISQVKAWILAKCIASTSGNPPSPSPNLPIINPPPKPKTRPDRRPASPIVFAEFSPVDGNSVRGPLYDHDGKLVTEEKPKGKKRRGRGRPISPITFAPIGGADPEDESDYDPFKSHEGEGDVIGMGYEEDDEWESSEDGTDAEDLELELDSKPRLGRRANRNQYLGFRDRPLTDQSASALPPSAASRALSKINPASLPKGSYTTYHPSLLTVIRFSTGQILERHLTVQDYELKPYELLEIHRYGVVTKLPREITFKYIEPYWEGYVKALRVVFREPRALAEARMEVRRNAGLRKDAPVEELLKTALDGVYMTKTNSSAEASARRAMEALAGGPVPSTKAASLGPADTVLGLRPPHSQLKGKNVKSSVTNDLDFIPPMTKSGRQGSNLTVSDGASLGRSSTISSIKPTTSSPSVSNSRRKGGQLEWRERWVFIKDGVLHLKKENSESPLSTTQILPLDSLTELRGGDHIGRTASAMQQTPNMRIVCAKFKTRMTTSRSANVASESNRPTPSHSRKGSLGKIVTSHASSSAVVSANYGPKSKLTHSSKPSKSSALATFVTHGSNRTSSKPAPASSSSHLDNGIGVLASGSGAHHTHQYHHNHNLQSSSGLGTGSKSPNVLRPTSPLSLKPKIMLQINPLPPPAPTSRVIQTQERTSSLAHVVSHKKDRGNGKAPETNSVSAPTSQPSSDVPSGPPSAAASEILDENITDEEGAVSEGEFDDDADAGGTGQLVKAGERKKSRRPRMKQGLRESPVINPTERRHPTIAMESDADSNASGGSLSSPVFAHSDDDSSPLAEQPGVSRSYGYGFGGNSEWRKKKGEKAEEGSKRGHDDDEENAEADSSYVVVDGAESASVAQGPKPSASKATLASKDSSVHREKLDPDSEWIVLDLGDDFGTSFRSFLRVVHRHAPHIVDSSFLSTLPAFQRPYPNPSVPSPVAPAPTPNFTSPFPSPNQSMLPTSLDQWSWNTARLEQVRRPITEEVSPVTTPVVDKPASPESKPGPLSPPTEAAPHPPQCHPNEAPSDPRTPISPPQDSKLYRLPPSPTYENARAGGKTSPMIGAAFGGRTATGSKYIQTSMQKNSLGTLGALPYPEWRLEIVTKAQRAGMGELTRAMDQFLWSDNPGLALLSREFGLSMAPMEILRSPSIHTAAGDRFSINGDGDSTEDASSIRKQKRRRKKMTLEQERIVMGLEFNSSTAASSSTVTDVNQHSVDRNVSSASNSISEQSSTSTLPIISDIAHPSLKLSYADADSSESGEESSDAEWMGWMADLHRQGNILQQQAIHGDRPETESVGSDIDFNDYWDYQQQDDHRRYQLERRALEPFGVVTSSSPQATAPTTPITASMQGSSLASDRSLNATLASIASLESNTASALSNRPATPSGRIGGSTILTSPSSNESLGKSQGRRLSFGLSPSDPPSSATSPALSQIGHGVEVYDQNAARTSKHHRKISARDGPHLSHYASTGWIGSPSGSMTQTRESDVNNSNLTSARRPSMPSLGSSTSAVKPDSLSFVPPTIPSSSSVSATSGGWPAVERWGTSASLARSIVLQPSQPQSSDVHPTIPRRSSTMGSVSTSSVGRSSSMLGKPTLLRKKDPEGAKVKLAEEQDRERDLRVNKGKEKSKKGKEREHTPDLVQEAPTDDKAYRPRLSLSMDSHQASTSGTTSLPPTSPDLDHKRRIRRIRSGQSLFSAEDGPVSISHAGIRNKSPPAKKKNIVRERAEKLLQGLESTLDFVDAR